MISLLVSFNSFLSVKGSILEQKSVNNAYYSEKSFQHAEQGLRTVKSKINQYLIANPTTKKLSDIPASETNLILPNVYSTTINGNQIISTGLINGIGLRRVTQLIELTAGSGGAAALNALGTINLGGSTSASNAKAGGVITGNVPAQAEANTKEFKVALLDHNDHIIKDLAGNIIYRSMTSNEYFIYYFGGLCPIAKAAYEAGDLSKADDCKAEAKGSVAANSKGYICVTDCSSKTEDDKIVTAYNSGKRIFWLDSGGLDHKVDFGTEADPVLIFVMNVPDASKAARINANSTIFGILYVDILDVQTTLNCSCSADSEITDIVEKVTYVNDLTKPIFTLTSNGGTKCSNNSGCADSQGNVIPKNSRYLTTYQQKVSNSNLAPVYGNFSNPVLNSSSPPLCTLNSCVQGFATATMDCSGGSVVGDAGTCSFVAVAVSGSNSTPLQIEITGTWVSNGSGNSIVQGAVITSGNYDGTGNATYIQNSTAITNIIFGGIGGGGFKTQPATMTFSAWSDMN